MLHLTLLGAPTRAQPVTSGPRHSHSPGPSVSEPGRVQMPDQQVLGKGPMAPRVVLLGMGSQFPQESWPVVERRAAAELRALGLEVVHEISRARGSDARMAELGAQAARNRAVAALRVVRNDQGKVDKVALWLHDALTGKMLLRQISVRDFVSPQEQGRAVLQVVELLNASLVELRVAGARRPPHVPATVERLVSAALDPAATPRGSYSAWLGPRATFALDSPRAQGGLTIGASWRPLATLPWLVGGLEIGIPVIAASVADARARTSAATTLIGALIQAEPWPEARVSPAVGLGLGALLLRASGEASATDAMARVDWAAVFIGSLRAQLALSISAGVRLLAALSVGLAVPAIELRFGDQTVATAGQPSVDVALAVEWAWGRQ